jgi:hypothetical protein
MSKVLVFFAVATLLCSCTEVPLSEQDQAIADTLHFDKGTMATLRTLTKEPFHTLADDAGLEFDYNPKADKYERVRKKLRSRDYLLFKSVENFGNLPDEYAVIKSKDQFDIIRLRGTGGHNYEISNDSLLIRLQDWHKRYGLEILGADADWVAIKMNNIPENELNSFAREIYMLCPDIAEDGIGDTEDLVQELKGTKSIYLWWD